MISRSPPQPQLYPFLNLMDAAGGDEVHKWHIAEEPGLKHGASFRTADILKRHKQVYTIFVNKDHKRHHWLKSDFVTLKRGSQTANTSTSSIHSTLKRF